MGRTKEMAGEHYNPPLPTGKDHVLLNKLLEIQREVDSFTKDKKGFNYNYTTGDQVLNKIRPLMNEKRLLLKQEVITIDNERMDYEVKSGPKSEILTKTTQIFTWICCETGEREVVRWAANGQNDWDKGLGSALTYAERYFLLKFFHVPTDEVDPDKRQGETYSPKKREENVTFLEKDQFEAALNCGDATKIKNTITRFSGTNINGVTYRMKKEYKEKLTKKMEELK